jgi:release factor glutamine methyltransferase
VPDEDRGQPGRDELVLRLRAAGCVFAEDEAEQLWATFPAAQAREQALRQREQGAPLEHVLGHAVFDGRRVSVAPGVFVPRRRAEPLVPLAAAAARAVEAPACLVDLGCGSGAIAAALAVRVPGATVLATEIDPGAAACARRNAATYGFAVHRGDWFDALPAAHRGRVAVVVAYLPHVPTEHLGQLSADFRAAEPLASVHGGADGLDPLRAVLEQAPRWLRDDGVLVTMAAPHQAAGVEALAAAGGWALTAKAADDDAFFVLRRTEGARPPRR